MGSFTSKNRVILVLLALLVLLLVATHICVSAVSVQVTVIKFFSLVFDKLLRINSTTASE